jgi:peptide/nickel transport system substrate-binding protein
VSNLLSASKPADVTAAKQALQTMEMEKIYKVPLFTIGYMNYVNTNRVAIPETVTDLGCPGHRVDVDFASWYIK